MSWNYRVTRCTAYDEAVYAIREVYYHPDGRISAWTQSPVCLVGEYITDIKKDIQLILNAFDNPAIDITDEDNPYEVES